MRLEWRRRRKRAMYASSNDVSAMVRTRASPDASSDLQSESESEEPEEESLSESLSELDEESELVSCFLVW